MGDKLWDGKNRAVTFSFDDGVIQDKKLIEILDKYKLKATFNINSSLLGLEGQLSVDGQVVEHNKVDPYNVKELYAGHEVAVHTLTHPNLTGLKDRSVIWQVEGDRLALERLTNCPVLSMAYPCGGINNDERVAKIIKEKTNIRFARTITSTYSFDLQNDLYRYNPSVNFLEFDKLFELCEKFIALKTDELKVFYIWGHSYELDTNPLYWEYFEEFCRRISKLDNIFYGTNIEVFNAFIK